MNQDSVQSHLLLFKNLERLLNFDKFIPSPFFAVLAFNLTNNKILTAAATDGYEALTTFLFTLTVCVYGLYCICK